MILYLVGVEHESTRYIQTRGLTKNNLAFIEAIESAMREHSYDLLAEEEQPERLIKLGAISLLQAIHLARNIRHAFVDPNVRERERIGYKEYGKIAGLEDFKTQVSQPLLQKNEDCECEILKIAYAHEIAHQFSIREMFWIEELKKSQANEILFVCGDIHLDTFPRLLGNCGIDSKIERRSIGISGSEIEYAAFEFAKQNGLLSEAGCFCKQPAFQCSLSSGA